MSESKIYNFIEKMIFASKDKIVSTVTEINKENVALPCVLGEGVGVTGTGVSHVKDKVYKVVHKTTSKQGDKCFVSHFIDFKDVPEIVIETLAVQQFLIRDGRKKLFNELSTKELLQSNEYKISVKDALAYIAETGRKPAVKKTVDDLFEEKTVEEKVAFLVSKGVPEKAARAAIEK